MSLFYVFDFCRTLTIVLIRDVSDSADCEWQAGVSCAFTSGGFLYSHSVQVTVSVFCFCTLYLQSYWTTSELILQ